VVLAGALTAGSLFFGPVKNAVAYPGDKISGWHTKPGNSAGAAYDNLEDKLYFIDNEDQKVYSRNPPDWNDASEQEILSLEPGDEYFGLGFGRVSGAPQLAAANVTDCELEIYDVNTGMQINSKTMPGTPGGPAGPRGVTFDGENWCVNFLETLPVNVRQYNPLTLNLENTINLSDNGINEESEITFDSDRNLFYILRNTSGFYTFRISGDNATNVNYFDFSVGAGNDFVGAAFREGALELILTEDWTYTDIVNTYEGYDAPVTPTPIPTPTPEANGTGIFRPSSGLWAINGVTRTYFGGSNDTPVYNDFDGDGIKDISIFRKNSGLWAVRNGERKYFGGSNDTPIPADYEGNGKDDIAIYRGNSGLWAVKGISRAYFGSSDDTPVPADYDGDGTKDIAIFRASSGLWAVKGITRAYFGGFSDIPVPGDYDGDGTSRIGIFRPASGLWAIRGVSRIYFGGSSDQPVPGDYAGDGTEDIGIFRDSSGLWAIRGLSRCYFGGVGDIPVTR
jgi:hypothetical protein